MKSLVFETPVNSAEELVARISAAAGEIRNTPEMLSNVRRSMKRRCEACITCGGQLTFRLELKGIGAHALTSLQFRSLAITEVLLSARGHDSLSIRIFLMQKRKNVPEISSFLDSRVEMNQGKAKKQDLVLLAEELGQKVSDKMTNIELRNIIIGSKDYEEEFVRAQLSVILEERLERESEEKIARQLAIEEEKIARQLAIEQQQREFELEKMRLKSKDRDSILKI
ncbi:hypothetical protein TNCV_5135791 [Trichonephila clavipes]|nr:hypothetical protein TNCV_5135791 [Trichonephila clavipes]